MKVILLKLKIFSLSIKGSEQNFRSQLRVSQKCEKISDTNCEILARLGFRGIMHDVIMKLFRI